MMSLRHPVSIRTLKSWSRFMRSQHDVTYNKAPSSTFKNSFHTSQNCLVKVPKPASFSKVRFTTADIPPLEFWQQSARPPLVPDGDLSPEKCLAAVQQYCSLALSEPSALRTRITRASQTLSPYILHYIAAMVVTGPPLRSWNIALHILNTLVFLKYTPSILTMVRLALNSNKLGQSQFALAQAAFDELLKRRDNPNASTLQGLILAAKKTPVTDQEALKWFRTAGRLGGTERESWDWQASNMLEMGKVYLRLGQPEKAKVVFEYGANGLDVAEACWLYATLLEPGHEREFAILKAAVSGIEEAAREMAKIEGDKTFGTGATHTKSWVEGKSKALQKEWEAVAGDRTFV